MGIKKGVTFATPLGQLFGEFPIPVNATCPASGWVMRVVDDPINHRNVMPRK